MSSSSILEEAVRFHQLGNLNEAESRYLEVLKFEPEHPDSLHLLGVIAQQRGKPSEAVDFILKAIRLKPRTAVFHSSLGIALRDLNKYESAKASYEEALLIDPFFTNAMINLCSLALEMDEADEALKWATQARNRDGSNPNALSYAGVALRKLKRTAEALPLYIEALKLSPNDAKIWTNYGNALREMNLYEEALKAQDRATELAPHFFEAWSNRGKILAELGRLDEALASYDESLSIAPQFADANWNKSLILLQQQKWEEGFRLYEARRYRKGAFHFSKEIAEWMGQDLKGKNILIYAEQGLGDVFQFIRFTKNLHDLGANVSLSCPPTVHRLLETFTLAPLQLVGFEFNDKNFHFQSSLMSLPEKLKVRAEDIEVMSAYLKVDAEIAKSWEDKLKNFKKIKVGLAWQGNPAFPEDRNRSISLSEFNKVLENPNVEFFSLQKGFGSEQIKALGFEKKIHDFSDSLDSDGNAFIDTAALMKQMDVIISSDTSIVHLAGALGCKAWMLTQKIPDWRWGTEGEPSLWYSSLQLVRQKKLFDWSDVMNEIALRLKGEVHGS